jgi:hypothetical protein
MVLFIIPSLTVFPQLLDFVLFGFPLALVTPAIGVGLMRLATAGISMLTGGRDTIFDYFPVTIY